MKKPVTTPRPKMGTDSATLKTELMTEIVKILLRHLVRDYRFEIRTLGNLAMTITILPQDGEKERLLTLTLKEFM